MLVLERIKYKIQQPHSTNKKNNPMQSNATSKWGTTKNKTVKTSSQKNRILADNMQTI